MELHQENIAEKFIEHNKGGLNVEKSEIIEIKVLSSLEKVFLNSHEQWQEISVGNMLKSEKFSFQIAVKLKSSVYGKIKADIRIESKLEKYIKIKEVKSVPSEMPAFSDFDDNYLTTQPGLFPDLLVDSSNLSLVTGQWRAIWVIVDSIEEVNSGKYNIGINIVVDSFGINENINFELEIIDAILPKQSLIHTEWFYCDCIAQFHKVEVFSNEFWNLTEKYIKMAADYGINMILTPLFTPPLDTQIGGERLTVQLIDVYLTKGVYKFSFEKLKKWVELCKKNKIEYFEFSHFFTQWGAEFTPKILASKDGKIVQLFGWHVASDSKDYKDFLRAFLIELKVFIKENELENFCYFHVSDEPTMKNIEQYKKAYELLKENLKEEIIIDALSDYEFYRLGIIKNPIPASNHLKDFIENDVPNLWTYYCCSQYREVSNRFMAMPSMRNRILGIQLYKYNIEGFLHWGYNFYNSRYSLESINPYVVTDSNLGFPSGDAFLVYPTEDGVTESIRLIVLNEAMQDLRAMRLLEKLTSRDYVLNLISKSWDFEITFDHFPKQSEYILNLRKTINEKIALYKNNKKEL